MNMNEYQQTAHIFAEYPHTGHNLTYCIVSLCGECGELANFYKKEMRAPYEMTRAEFSERMLDEMGDILWYLSEMATVLGFSMELVASENIKKLQRRKERGDIKGIKHDDTV